MTLPAGVILAGGQSRRMGLADKALAPLAGQPMIQHVIQRVQPQVSTLILNAPAGDQQYNKFGLDIVPDASADQGPLAGLLAALSYVAESELAEWLLLCPCDAPFLPIDLGERLLESASGRQASLVGYGGILQATFSLWHVDADPAIRRAVLEENKGGFKQVLPQIPHRILDWELGEPSPFFNVNTPTDLELAEQLHGHQ